MNNNDITRHTISVLVDNLPGVLSRVTGLFSGRGFNIECLAVAETLDPKVSRITMVTSGSPELIEQVTKQLRKLVNTIKVQDLTETDFVEREMALIRVKAEPQFRRGDPPYRGHFPLQGGRRKPQLLHDRGNGQRRQAAGHSQSSRAIRRRGDRSHRQNRPGAGQEIAPIPNPVPARLSAWRTGRPYRRRPGNTHWRAAASQGEHDANLL